jgi:hypothetical protein
MSGSAAFRRKNGPGGRSSWVPGTHRRPRHRRSWREDDTMLTASLEKGRSVSGAVSRWFGSMLNSVPPAGFEPALTAPERVAVYASDQRKHARRDLARAHIGRSPPTLRSAGVRPAFRLTLHDRHRASVRRAAPSSIWAATLSRRWPSGAVPNRVIYAQTRRPTVDRICRCERILSAHAYAEFSISIRDQQCDETRG